MKFSEKLIKLRKEKGLSQEEFANEIGVSRQAVSKWETESVTLDIDRVKDIAKFYDVSFDYLLNDEIENIENINEYQTKKTKKTVLKVILIIILVILAIYLITSIYKVIALNKFYQIANSFDEQNYWINTNLQSDDGIEMYQDLKKVNNKIINVQQSKNKQDKYESISYIDLENNEQYMLIKNEDNTYSYLELDEEEVQSYVNNENYIKENTLAIIPANTKEILANSFNPFVIVSLSNKSIKKTIPFQNIKMRTTLTNDYLVESFSVSSDFDSNYTYCYSYDYVNDHFSEIESPIDLYKDKIVSE